MKKITHLIAALLFPLAAIAETVQLTDAEVRKVDKEAGKITLRHGPIENLEMPAMTMVFNVKDASMLEVVKAGEKVRFAAEKLKGNFTVTRIEAAK